MSKTCNKCGDKEPITTVSMSSGDWQKNEQRHERREKSLNYLENRIFPEMEKSAAEGRLYTEFYVDAWVDMKAVTDELTANGYTHSKNGRNLKIYWV